VTGCFYRRRGTRGDSQTFESTDLTRSNWDSRIQHGSPPLALLTKVIQERADGSQLRIARICLDILGPIPVAEVRVRAWVERPGNRVSLLAAEMFADLPGGTTRALARASAWLLIASDTRDVACDRHLPLTEGEAAPLPAMFRRKNGYFDAIRWRPQRTDPDADRVWWCSPLVHVVDTEPDTALVKLAAVVDSANGVGATLDPDRFVYMNTDTTVHMHRLPVDDDFGLRARASSGPDGAGVTTAEIFDRRGFVGTSAQTLLVQRR